VAVPTKRATMATAVVVRIRTAFDGSRHRQTRGNA
jgi:hypothetical protein